MNQLPTVVNILDEHGDLTLMSYRDLKEHEEDIITDNICFGLTHMEYTEEDIHKYEKQAWAQWKELKRQLRENPKLILTLDRETERYVSCNHKADIVQLPSTARGEWE